MDGLIEPCGGGRPKSPFLDGGLGGRRIVSRSSAASDAF